MSDIKKCLCGCGGIIPIGSHHKKRFIDQRHYNRWYSQQRRNINGVQPPKKEKKAKPYKVGDVFRHWTVTGIGSTYLKVFVKCRCGFEAERFIADMRNGKSEHCHNCRYGIDRKVVPKKFIYGPRPKSEKKEAQYVEEYETPNTIYTEKVSVGGRIYSLEVDSSKVVQPKTGANKMRITGKCHVGGTCKKYGSCGDKEFKGDCTGHSAPRFHTEIEKCGDVY